MSTNSIDYVEVLNLVETPERLYNAVAIAANAVSTEEKAGTFEMNYLDVVASLPFVFAAIKDEDPEFENQERYASITLIPTGAPEDHPAASCERMTLQEAITHYLMVRSEMSRIEAIMAELTGSEAAEVH